MEVLVGVLAPGAHADIAVPGRPERLLAIMRGGSFFRNALSG